MENYPEIMEYLSDIPNIKLFFKNEEEIKSLLMNVRYIISYIQQKIEMDKNEVIEIHFQDENMFKIKISSEIFQLYIMNEEELIEFMIEHFDDFFHLYYFSPSFLYSYFSNEKYSNIYIGSESFLKKIIECCCEDEDLHLMLKNGIRDIHHFVQYIIDIDGIHHYLDIWNEEYYINDDDIFVLCFES